MNNRPHRGVRGDGTFVGGVDPENRVGTQCYSLHNSRNSRPLLRHAARLPTALHTMKVNFSEHFGPDLRGVFSSLNENWGQNLLKAPLCGGKALRVISARSKVATMQRKKWVRTPIFERFEGIVWPRNGGSSVVRTHSSSRRRGGNVYHLCKVVSSLGSLRCGPQVVAQYFNSCLLAISDKYLNSC